MDIQTHFCCPTGRIAAETTHLISAGNSGCSHFSERVRTSVGQCNAEQFRAKCPTSFECVSIRALPSRAGEESRGESGLNARHRLSRLPAIRGSASVLASRTAQPSGCDTRNHRSNEPNASSHAYSERWFLGRFGAFSFFLSLLKKKRKRRQSPLCRRNDACMCFGKCPTGRRMRRSNSFLLFHGKDYRRNGSPYFRWKFRLFSFF